MFTVTCCGARSAASARVRPCRPAFAAITCAWSVAPVKALSPPILMMRPTPPRTRCGAAAWAQKNAPSSVMPSTSRHSASVTSPSARRRRTEALFTRMSRRPCAATTASTIRRTSSCCDTSHSATVALTPVASASRRTASAASRLLRPCTITFAPARARVSTISRPIRREDPVTSATRPASWRSLITRCPYAVSPTSSPPLHVPLDPGDEHVSNPVAVAVPHHDVIVAPDARLRDAIIERRAWQFRQRLVGRIAARLLDLVIGLKTRTGLRPADLVDAVDAQGRHLGEPFHLKLRRQVAIALRLDADQCLEQLRLLVGDAPAHGAGRRMRDHDRGP